nr:MAG TPA: hypothetical protein [Caudoviricetes sp.]
MRIGPCSPLHIFYIFAHLWDITIRLHESGDKVNQEYGNIP